MVPRILFRPQAVLHRQHVLGQQVAGVLADDGHAQDAVLAGHGEHLDEAVRGAVGDGAVEVVDAVARHLVGDALLLLASVSFRPTRATSGSVKVAQGITE
jgi:hypothetical protein